MSRKPLALLGGAVLLLAAAAFAATTLTVQVQSTRLRETPKQWGASLATLNAGTKLTESKRQGDWVFVTTPSGKTGWVHASAVTSRNVALTSSGGNVSSGTSSKDVSMADKGFNPQVEAEYAKTRNVDFAAVDGMLAITVTDEELEAFLKAGKLADWGVGP